MNFWSTVAASNYGALSAIVAYARYKDEQRMLAYDTRHFFGAWIVKYMDPALEAWEAHRSHEEVIQAWESAVHGELEAMASRIGPDKGQELRAFVREMMERVVRHVFIRTAWDHVQYPEF